MSMFLIDGVIMSVRRLLGSAMNLIMWAISLVNYGRTKKTPRKTNIDTALASCHILICRFVESAGMVRASVLSACSMLSKGPATRHTVAPP